MKPASFLLFGVVALSMMVTLDPGLASQAQEDGHPAAACSAPYHVSGAGWDFCWQQDNPRAQGLELNQVYFHGDSVAWKMGVPFTLTQYESATTGPFKDTLGSPGSGGHPGYGRGALQLGAGECPRFFGDQSTLLHGNRVCVEHRGGAAEAIAIWSRFDIYNYRFLQGWILDSRGVIEPVIAMGGLLIDGSSVGAQGTNHYHHLYTRIDLDVAADGNDQFQVFSRIAGGVLAGGTLDGSACSVKGIGTVTTWCTTPLETKLVRDHVTHPKWRVVDSADTNAQNHQRSYELTAHSDGPPDDFSTFDVMVVQYKGDSTEVGYEVPMNPMAGDAQIGPYMLPPEPIDDPVVWVSQHVYHDTRDEDRGSMTPHYVDYEIRPNNFMDSNPGEDSYPWN